MTDRIAFGVGSLIVMAIAADLIFDAGVLVFLARRLDSFVEYLAFWR
ncbi:hypothetical protein ACFQXB_04645 [Plastorhodobacter daqingensis]|uniref:Glyceraldehyde-3-phosphate dehydrogenase n=1 Tax=Plastorhodobacter daqingensis TaxID=1387281 RepID=A0ABW2UFM6_9RHOB